MTKTDCQLTNQNKCQLMELTDQMFGPGISSFPDVICSDVVK